MKVTPSEQFVSLILLSCTNINRVKPGMSVDDFLGASFMEGEDDEDSDDDEAYDPEARTKNTQKRRGKAPLTVVQKVMLSQSSLNEI